MKNFSNKYQLSKTLRFELIPQGKTKEHISKKGLLTQDEQRALDYKTAKGIIDEYHKTFIEKALGDFSFDSTKNNLTTFSELYSKNAEEKKTDAFKKDFDKAKENLRKAIVKKISETEGYKNLFAKELITEDLPKYLSEQNEKELVEKLKTFTTYFTGFHENRKNMYKSEGNATEISFRIVHENLPKFLDNAKIFEKVQATFGEQKISEIQTALQTLINSRTKTLSEVFTLDFFNQVLTQNGIDFYNTILGGWTEENGTKNKGLNEYINTEYNQKPENSKSKLPKLKPLYKMILSDRESVSFLPEAFEKANEVINAVNDFHTANLGATAQNESNILQNIKTLVSDLQSTDCSKIYIRNDKALTDISQAIFGDYGVIKSALAYPFEDATHKLKELNESIAKSESERKKATDKDKKKELKTKIDEEKNKRKSLNETIKSLGNKEKYLKQSHYSIAEIETAIYNYREQTDSLKERKLTENSHPICDYFRNFGTEDTSTTLSAGDKDLLVRVSDAYSAMQGIFNVTQDEKFSFSQQQTDNLKFFLDRLMDLLHFVKPLALPKDSSLEKDETFYGQFAPLYEELDKLILLYNKVRNFATKKPYSVEKFKLNFENPEFLGGWPLDREIATSGVIFQSDNYYYLGVLDKASKRHFKNHPKPIDKNDVFFKMVYLQAADPSKDVQNLMVIDGKTVKKNGRKEKTGEFSGQNLILENLKNEHLPNEINKIRKERSYSKLSDTFSRESLVRFIEFYKQRAIEYFDDYNFEFKESKDYKDFGDFTDHINTQAYQIKFDKISQSYINQLVDEGKLYLFKIHNKDFSAHSKGTPNMHTLYWKALFDEKNLKDVIYKLSGQAEIFYRKKSIDKDKIITHKANEAIDNKNPNATKKQSTFEYDLVKDKRFTVDKFQFHVPITLNFKASGGDFINQDVLAHLKNNPDVNIIGIDRGERHLIYLSLIDQKGNILQQETLNTVTNEKHNITTPYHTLLAKKEEERDKARKNWGTIENIKELKEGYLSQVVHKIAKMMVEHNAIVVMEDLNFGFKRGRFKVEKQVYQKLEKMLIDKLNYLVFKDKPANEPGGLYKALQLTNKFTSFKDLDKQSGFLFYVPAWNTSKIDPTTGFVNLFDTKYESQEKAKQFFDRFKSIRFNSEKNYFEFAFDYNDFTTRAEGTKSDWVVCTHGERILTFRNQEANNQWDNKEVRLTEQFEDVLDSKNIVYGDGKCIKAQIAAINDKSFFEKLLHLFKLTLQMRNSKTSTDIDYLISPVMNKNGTFYDSRTADSTLPKDADANGAYHIAKKGLWVLEQINQTEDFKKLKLAISNKEWLNFVQSNI